MEQAYEVIIHLYQIGAVERAKRLYDNLVEPYRTEFEEFVLDYLIEEAKSAGEYKVPLDDEAKAIVRELQGEQKLVYKDNLFS